MITPAYEAFVNNVCMEDNLLNKGIQKLSKLSNPNYKSAKEKEDEQNRNSKEKYDKFINTPEYKKSKEYFENHKNQLVKAAINLALKEIKKDIDYKNIKISDLKIIDNGYSKFKETGNYIHIWWIYPEDNTDLCYGVFYDFNTDNLIVFDAHDKYYNNQI